MVRKRAGGGGFSNPQQFFKKMSPFAVSAAAQLGMPAKVILAQWALESAYGTSSLARESNNFAGIKYTSHADGKNGSYSAYNSITSFTQDYVRVLNSSYYDQVRQASGVNDTIEALARSPYATDANYGQEIKSILDSRDITVTAGTNVLSILTTIFGSPILWIGAALYLIFKD